MRQSAYPARRDLLDWIKLRANPFILQRMQENPETGLNELKVMNRLLFKEELESKVSKKEPDFKQRGWIHFSDNVHRYKGNDWNSNGLWVRNGNEWIQYDIGSTGLVTTYDGFEEINPLSLLPLSIEKNSTRKAKVKDASIGELPQKRFIGKMSLDNGDQRIPVYVKGNAVLAKKEQDGQISHDRLTDIKIAFRKGAKKEAEYGQRLAQQGVNVPRIIGTYESKFEDYIFMDEIKGSFPNLRLGNNRTKLIMQDARMLGNMCLAGIRKSQFSDFTDKMFDGKDLYLIDFDECQELYDSHGMSAEEIQKRLREVGFFERRRLSKIVNEEFTRSLRDNLSDYKGTLIRNDDDLELYVREFYGTVGWRNPSLGEVLSLGSIGEGYVTRDKATQAIWDEVVFLT